MHLFYQPDLSALQLTPEESHHAIRVMRMRVGDPLEVTDGLGTLASAQLTSTQDRKAGFRIIASNKTAKPSSRIHLAIAPTKNMDRMEWLVEKCTEIGVGRISFIHCKTSERPKISIDRLSKIAISAMKQSGQVWLPELVDMIPFKDFLKAVNEPQRFIAYVDATNPDHLSKILKPNGDSVLLIGPEGDFTKEELELALSGGFKKVSLGPNRLRTETAGVYGVAILNAII